MPIPDQFRRGVDVAKVKAGQLMRINCVHGEVGDLRRETPGMREKIAWTPRVMSISPIKTITASRNMLQVSWYSCPWWRAATHSRNDYYISVSSIAWEVRCESLFVSFSCDDEVSRKWRSKRRVCAGVVG